MGYNTTFELSVKGSGPIYEKLKEDIENEVTFGRYDLPIVSLINNDCEPMKWYDHDDDMKELSKQYPNVLFILSGEGEEAGDIWRSYYRNGAMQEVKAKITFDEPNLNLLPEVDTTDIELTIKDIQDKKESLRLQAEELEKRLNSVKTELDTL